MQSSTNAGNDGTRKYPAQHQQQQQSVGTAGAGGAAPSPGATNQTTSFTVNGNTPSKNPFKQQLDNNPQLQQNGMEQDSCGIMGLGKEQQQQQHRQPPPLPPQSYGTRQMTTGGQPPPPDEYRQEDPRAAGHWSAAKSWMVSWRGSNRLVLVIVAIALLLDNMLLTTVGK